MSLREDSQKAIEAAQHYEATEAMPTWARVALISAMTEHATVLLLASDEMFCLMTGKYGEFLRPFVALMERKLYANAGKGDRDGWLAMSPEVAMLEIHQHVAKLQKAVLNGDIAGVREHVDDGRRRLWRPAFGGGAPAQPSREHRHRAHDGATRCSARLLTT